MNTSIIVRSTMYVDPVWGATMTDWVSTSPIRVTRNRLRNAHIEWVGGEAIGPDEWADLCERYPLVKHWSA